MIWNQLNYFNRAEAWGNPDKVTGCLLMLLEAIRGRVKDGFVIHNAYSTDGHSANSQHYLGNAVDFHINTNMGFRKQIYLLLGIFNELQVAQHIGFGIYPQWNHPGFHLDIRGTRARWGYVNGYVSFSDALATVIKE